jgi:hypothetical protein
MGFIQHPSQIRQPELLTWDNENELIKSDLGCTHYYTLDELLLLKSYIDRAISSIHHKRFDLQKVNEISYMKSVEAQQRCNPKSLKPQKTSIVYLAYDSNSNAYKIGCSSNVKSRAKSLKTANPYLTITHIISGGYDTEAYYHNILSPYKVRGEWFKLSSDAMKQFIRDWGFKPI